eukprot:scaffold10417_cov137-Skeletonema_marinoi.AAC.20
MTYRFTLVVLFVLLATSANNNVANGFRVGSDGNQDLMKRAVEDALLNTAKQPPIAKDDAPPLRNQLLNTEIPCLYEYWSRPDIHTFGNMGFGGAIHAAMAPFATKMIDVKAYGGQDVRKLISEELRVKLDVDGARVCDLCCGVGISTRALGKAFHDAELIVGVDTSPEMISMAKAISSHEQGVRSVLARHNEGLKNLLGQKHKAITEAMTVIDTDPYPDRRHFEATYELANAEHTELPNDTFNLVTIMYAFHEVPKEARSRIIQEAKRLLKVGGTLAVVDISPTYTPSKYMLAGEPFVIEYQQNIDKQLGSAPGFMFSKRKEIVPGHVNMWLLTSK